MRVAGYGQGVDSSLYVVGDPAFCEAIHGKPNLGKCHLEGWPDRLACELYLLGGQCPIWKARSDGSESVVRDCLQHDADERILTCDHFGDTSTRDDPQTPAFEGEPQVCGLQRDAEGNPRAGFFTIAHGTGIVTACLPDGTGCGNWMRIDY